MDTPSSASAGPAPLGRLLSETFEYCKMHWQTLVIGAVVFGVLIGLINMVIGANAAYTVKTGINEMGLDVERMEELGERVEAGDETAMAELEEMLNDRFEGKTDEEIAQEMMVPGMAMFKNLLPSIGLSILVTLVLSFFAHAYYSLVAVEGKDLNATVNRSMKVLLPLAGVSLWTFLRSFLWIPFLGIILAIILGPRFIASSLIYLTEGKGVMQSVSDSYRRTQGYWAKIAGNAIVAGIIAIVVSIVLNMIVGIFLMSIPSAILVLQQVIQQLMMAFMTVFVVRLSHTVLQHPRA